MSGHTKPRARLRDQRLRRKPRVVKCFSTWWVDRLGANGNAESYPFDTHPEAIAKAHELATAATRVKA